MVPIVSVFFPKWGCGALEKDWAGEQKLSVELFLFLTVLLSLDLFRLLQV